MPINWTWDRRTGLEKREEDEEDGEKAEKKALLLQGALIQDWVVYPRPKKYINESKLPGTCW